jgi:opacity protein-like surface antigen
MRRLIAAFVCIAALSGSAMAADMAVKAKPVDYVCNWTGFYLGGHVGYGWVSSSMSAADTAAVQATYGSVPAPKGFAGGIQGGYDWQLANRLVFGLGLELNGFGIDSLNATTGIAPGSSLKSTVDWDVTGFARLGYAMGRVMPYVLAGISFDTQQSQRL